MHKWGDWNELFEISYVYCVEADARDSLSQISIENVRKSTSLGNHGAPSNDEQPRRACVGRDLIDGVSGEKVC